MIIDKKTAAALSSHGLQFLYLLKFKTVLRTAAIIIEFCDQPPSFTRARLACLVALDSGGPCQKILTLTTDKKNDRNDCLGPQTKANKCTHMFDSWKMSLIMHFLNFTQNISTFMNA